MLQNATDCYNALDNPRPPVSTQAEPPFEDLPRPDPLLDPKLVIATLTRPLKPAQFQAIELLIAGHSDARVAQAVGVNRVTVSRWRLYNHIFQAEFNRRRDQVYANAADRARRALLKAVKILSRQLASEDQHLAFRAAALFLRNAHRFAPPPPHLAPLTPSQALDIEARKVRIENASCDPRTDPLDEPHRALALRKLRYFSAYHPHSPDEPK